MKKNLKILSLNCQKGYRVELKPFLQKILSESEYDFLLLQEVDTTVVSFLKEYPSMYEILNPFDADLGENTHECIVYRKSFTLKESSLVSFAKMNPNMPARGWGFLAAVFGYEDANVVVGSLHLHPGLSRVIRAKEINIIKDHLLKQVNKNQTIIFGGDCNFGLPGEIFRSEKMLSPEFSRVTKDLPPTLDSRYTETSSWGVARMANILAKLSISIKFKTDQLWIDSATAKNAIVQCRTLPDRVSDHLAIELRLSMMSDLKDISIQESKKFSEFLKYNNVLIQEKLYSWIWYALFCQNVWRKK